MRNIEREFKTKPCIAICFAADDNYAPYLKVAIYSLLCNRNTTYSYDIIILHTIISKKNIDGILTVSENQDNVSIRFIDVSEDELLIEYDTGAYYSIATNYRLFLFSEMFKKYNKILYLDSDLVILGDVSELFNIDMEGQPIAAVEDIGMKQVCYDVNIEILLEGKLYTGNTYCTDVLGLKHPETYFNAGVILLDLERCRTIFSFQEVLDILHGKLYVYNDQDVCNILFEGQVKKIEYRWNYQNYLEDFLMKNRGEYPPIFDTIKRTDYDIIHYIGDKKPWNAEVKLSCFYHKYVDMC